MYKNTLLAGLLLISSGVMALQPVSASEFRDILFSFEEQVSLSYPDGGYKESNILALKKTLMTLLDATNIIYEPSSTPSEDPAIPSEVAAPSDTASEYTVTIFTPRSPNLFYVVERTYEPGKHYATYKVSFRGTTLDKHNFSGTFTILDDKITKRPSFSDAAASSLREVYAESASTPSAHDRYAEEAKHPK